MKSVYNEYKETGMLGAYNPAIAVVRHSEKGVDTIFRDTEYRVEDDKMVLNREMLIGGKLFRISSVLPVGATATPTDKLISLIDLKLSGEHHGE